jgi:DNA-binding beta-propeller fold protein YncE
VHRRRRRSAISALAVTALVAAGCARSGPHGTPSGPLASSPAPPAATSSPSVPNPFTIVARYSPSSLGMRHPIALAIAPDGNVYVTDTAQSVTEISPGGTFIRRWGTAGTGPGQFRFTPQGGWLGSITVGADGRVYVSDSGNGRIEVFSSTGTFLSQFGSLGLGPGHLSRPDTLAVDGQGDAYVADQPTNTLSKFSPTGRFEWRIGGSSSQDLDLVGQFHVAEVDPHGRVVAANESGYVVYIDSSGHRVDAFRFSVPCGASLDSAGDTFVYTCPPNDDVQVFDRTHRLVGAWYGSPFWLPWFGPNGEAFVIGRGGERSILKLKVALPGA